LRRHAPLGAVDRSVEPHELAIPLELLHASGIAEQIVGIGLQFRIVAPLVGIADLDR
jgi:hypothetical protein